MERTLREVSTRTSLQPGHFFLNPNCPQCTIPLHFTHSALYLSYHYLYKACLDWELNEHSIRINAHWLRPHCKHEKTEPDRMRIESIHLLRWIETRLNWIGMECCWARSSLRDHVRTSVENGCWLRERGEQGEPECGDEGAVEDLGSQLEPSSSLMS